MILCKGQGRDAAGPQVGGGPHAEVGTVDVLMPRGGGSGVEAGET